MDSSEGLRLLAAFEVAKPFKKGIFFVAKGVVQVEEAWYADAMEVTRAINSYPMGPAERRLGRSNVLTEIPRFYVYISTSLSSAHLEVYNIRSNQKNLI